MASILYQLNIVSDDLDATVTFYRRLGVDIGEPIRSKSGRPFHASSKVAEGALLEADSVEFARIWNAAWQGEPELKGRVVIGLRVHSRSEVDKLYDQCLAAGHRGLQSPCDAFWGARYAIVEDPNGLAVGLMSPADREHKGPPRVPD